MFIQRDPIGLLGGSNVFAYAPNPIHWVDVLGLNCTKLGKNMGAKSGDGMANHHLIPEELVKDPQYRDMFKRLENIGWDKDNASNGTFLPVNQDLSNKIGLPGHWSNHKEYTNEIKKELNKLNKNYRKLSDLQLALGIKEIQDNARDGLVNGRFKTDPCTGRLI